MALSTLNGIRVAVTRREALQVAFPGTADPYLYGIMLAMAVVGLLALLGMWRWRRWGVMLYTAGAIVLIVLDVIVRAPTLHPVTVVAGALVILGLAFLNRDRFRLNGETTE